MTNLTQMTSAALQKLLKGKEWLTIEEMKAICDRSGFWSDQFFEQTTDEAKKQHLRRIVKQIKDDDRFPEYASVEEKDAEGKSVRRYKQEVLFNLEDYRRVVNYHAEVSNHHRAMAVEYAKRCKKRLHVQIKLSFGDE